MDIYPYINIEDDRLMELSIYFKKAQLQPRVEKVPKRRLHRPSNPNHLHPEQQGIVDRQRLFR